MKRQELLFFRKEIINSMIADLRKVYHDKTTYATKLFVDETQRLLVQLECDVTDTELWLRKNQFEIAIDTFVELKTINTLIKDTINLQRDDLNAYEDMVNEIIESKELTNFQKSENAIRLHEQEHGSINRFIIQIFCFLQRFVSILERSNEESEDLSQNTFAQIFPDSLFDISFTRSNDLKHLQPEQDDTKEKQA